MTRLTFIFLILGLFFCLPAHAETGSLQGRFSIEKSPIPVKGAKVTIGETVAEVTEEGTYSFEDLPPGQYETTYEWTTIGLSEKRVIDIAASEAKVVDFVMPFPRPHITRLFLPAVNGAKAVTIHGRHFLHTAQTAFEVRINEKPVVAKRTSDETIEVSAESVGQVLRSLGDVPRAALPVVVSVAGKKSNEAKLLFMATLPGNIDGRIDTDKKISILGARLLLPDRPAATGAETNGTFSFGKVPPRGYRVVLEWPALHLRQEVETVVSPGGTARIRFPVKIPNPEVDRAQPAAVDKAMVVNLQGRYFLHTMRAPMKVSIAGKEVKALRLSNDVIQLPEHVIAELLKGVKVDTTSQENVVVTVAGVASKPFPLTLVGGKAEAPRAVASEPPAAPAASPAPEMPAASAKAP